MNWMYKLLTSLLSVKYSACKRSWCFREDAYEGKCLRHQDGILNF